MDALRDSKNVNVNMLVGTQADASPLGNASTHTKGNKCLI